MIISQPSLSKGMQVKTSRFLTLPSELALALNVHGDYVGSWATRNGYTQTGNTLEADKSILGLHSLQQLSGNTLIGAVNNSNDSATVLKNLSGASWGTIGGTSFPANAEIEIINYLDKGYVVGANSTTFATSGTLDGTTYTENVSIPKARAGLLYFDQLHLIDCEVGGVRYPSRVYRGSIPASGVITFDTTNDYLQVQTDDGDWLTGGAVSYSQLLLFKQFSLHTWNLSSLRPQMIDDAGCISRRSIQNLGNNVFYFTYSTAKKGFYLWVGSGSKLVSKVIQPFIDGMSAAQAPYVCTGKRNNHVYAYIGDVTLATEQAKYYNLPSTISNVLCDLNWTDNQWALHSLPVDVKVMAEHNNELYFGDNTGKVYQWADGSDDAGTPIASMVITHPYYGQVPSQERNRFKQWRHVIINMQQANGAIAKVSIDGGDWKPLGECTGSVNRFEINEKGYSAQLMIAGAGLGFIYEGQDFDYDDLGVM